ncbi:ISL3 family transposase [Alloscardovia omnicolens]|uniref:ISL3 family transposase n=1 Tax=Alloscardovia omnicolens TaxID=419015 RepID=UPI003756FAD4
MAQSSREEKDMLEPDETLRLTNLRHIGIDETSYKKGHKYITVVVDHDQNQVVWCHEGTGKEVLDQFFESLTQKQRDIIEACSADGARWIKSCLDYWIPNCERCVDLFHVIEWATKAVDETRIEAWRSIKSEELKLPKRKVGRPKTGEEVPEYAARTVHKSMKNVLQKGKENLSENQMKKLESIQLLYPKVGKAYVYKEGLREVFKTVDAFIAEQALTRWIASACHCRIEPIVELSKKIQRHKEAILNTMRLKLSNARIEATNNKIKVIIRKAYGFRNIENMKAMIMLVCSKLFNRIKTPREELLETKKQFEQLSFSI